MINRQISRNVSYASLLLIVFLLQACAANLPAVRDFSKTTLVATDTFNNISDDLPKSCLRRVELTFEGKKVVIEEGIVRFSEKYKQALATCNDLKISLVGMIEANNVLQGYAEALGKLASDDVATFTTELEALRSNIGKINIKGSNPFTGIRADAVFNLASFLLNAVANGYRQKELIETIQMGQKHIGPLTEGLSAVADDYRIRILKLDKDKIRRFQVGILDDLDIANEKVEKKVLSEKLFETQKMIEAIDEKDKATSDYQEILIKIVTTHTKLSEQSNNLESQALIALIQSYAEQLIPLINNIREAYSN